MEIADALKNIVAQNTKLSFHQGVVTAIGTGSVTVNLSGGTDAISGVKYLDSYRPTVNDVVSVVVNNSDFFILGKLASIYTPPASLYPAFEAHNTGGTHTTNTGTILDFDATSLNRGSVFNTTTYKFTAPIAGIYSFDFNIYTQQGLGISSVAWRKNGNEIVNADTDISYRGSFAFSVSSGTITATVPDYTLYGSNLLELAASDTVDLAVRSTASSNLQWYGGHSRFSGYLVTP